MPLPKDRIKSALDLLFVDLRAKVLRKDPDALDSAFFAGGCIGALYRHETPNDYDVWFPSKEAWERAKDAMAPGCFVSHTIFSYTYLIGNKKVQFVRSRVGTPDEIVGGFDFKHTQSYYIPVNQELVILNEYHVRNKVLEYCKGNLKHPINTVKRMTRFIREGWELSGTGTLCEMMEDVRDVPKSFAFNSRALGGSR